jgi:hypothetical protein
MNLDAKDLFYEHFVIGFKGMFEGLFKQWDESWLLFPLLFFTRLAVYAIVSIVNFFQDWLVKR